MINLAVVDDKFINRKTIKNKLSRIENVKVIGEFENGEVFLNYLLNNQTDEMIDVVLMDLDMPKMNGIETIKACQHTFPNIKFIILTIFEDIDKIFEAICVGAHGYLLKEDNGLNIEQAIINCYEFNGMPMSPTIAKKAIELIKFNTIKTEHASIEKSIIITERELDVLKHLTTGLSYPKIGELMFISPLTVRKHVANIYEKLHVNSRTQLILVAQQKKLI